MLKYNKLNKSDDKAQEPFLRTKHREESVAARLCPKKEDIHFVAHTIKPFFGV